MTKNPSPEMMPSFPDDRSFWQYPSMWIGAWTVSVALLAGAQPFNVAAQDNEPPRSYTVSDYPADTSPTSGERATQAPLPMS